MKTVALVNLKGGVGKTSVTLGLAAGAAELGRRVLVVDLDPQANATDCLAPSLDPDNDLTVNDVFLSGEPGGLTDAIRTTGWTGVDLVASQLELDARESDQAANATHRLVRAMRGLGGYDLVLLDCRPSVGRLTTNALIAADSAIIVALPDRAAIRGIGEARRHVGVVAEDMNHSLRLSGIIVTQVREHEREQAYRLTEIIETFGTSVVRPFIPHRAVVAQAYGAGAKVRDMGGAAAREVADFYRAHAARLLDIPDDLDDPGIAVDSSRDMGTTRG